MIHHSGTPRSHHQFRNRVMVHGVGAAVFLGAVLLPCVQPAAAQSRLADSTVVIATQGASGSWINGPLGVAFDVPQGEIYVANSRAKTIEIFDLELIPVAFFRHAVRNDRGELIDGVPLSIAVDRERNLLVVDMLTSYVDVLDFRGKSLEILELPAPYDELSAGNGPGAVTVGPDGTIYVATRGEVGRVIRYSPEYELIDSWGEAGTAEGQLRAITAMAPLPDGKLVVACQGTEKAVQIFESDGTFVSGFGGREQGPGNFSFASGVTVTQDGRIWVSDEIRQFVDVFQADGSYVGRLGIGGRAPGEFVHPGAVATDGANYVAVAEKAGNRLQLFRIRGTGTSEATDEEGNTF